MPSSTTLSSNGRNVQRARPFGGSEQAKAISLAFFSSSKMFATAGVAYAASGMIDRLTAVLITDFGTGVRVAVPTAALAAMVHKGTEVDFVE